MKKIIYLCLLPLLAGCEGFLELQPKSEASADNFYQTAKNFNTALMGAYGQLQQYPDMYIELVSYRSDELTFGAPTAGTQDRYNIDKFTDDPSNQILLDAWGDLYNGISRCNEIIERLPASEISEELKKQYDAEARFLRAYHYFNLVNFWGSVPLVLKPLTAAEALKIGRSPVGDVEASLESDLELAIEHLPTTFAGNDAGRATSGAARTLLSKIYLRQEKYTEAANTLRPLIPLGGTYSLLPDISQVFSVTNKSNSEVVFAVRFNKEVSDGGHPLWLTTNSADATLVPAGLLKAYETNDARRKLLAYARSGASTTYVMNKFMDVLSTATTRAGNDYILLRYADVLLMFAEASNEVGFTATGEALDALNRVRTRAGLEAYRNGELDNQQRFRDAVLLERRLEFPYEGHRYFDLIRSGTIKEEIQRYEEISVPDFRLLYPLPQSEIEKIGNPSIFSQNPGYN